MYDGSNELSAEGQMARSKNEHAVALATLGASKGGSTRAATLTPEDRRAIAREAAEARWGNVLPMATHSGNLVIAGRLIACAVLENGKRVLTQETFLKTVGRAGKAKGGRGSSALSVDGLPPFLAAENLLPFISDELRQAAQPIAFRTQSGGRGYGYDAMLLPAVCEVYLQARDAKRDLLSQEHIVKTCDMLMRGLARVGIIALVDEATGYQEARAKDELHRILAAYIAPELMPWTKMFPDEFFKEIYRLQGWEYRPGSAKRTPYVGRLINKYIYDQLPDGVLEELQRRNPVTERGYRRHKHHQFLTADTGNVHLDKQISTVTTLMRIADDRDEFEALFERAFGKVEPRRPLVIDVDPTDGTPTPRLAQPTLF
jgi:hypothetical protein